MNRGGFFLSNGQQTLNHFAGKNWYSQSTFGFALHPVRNSALLVSRVQTTLMKCMLPSSLYLEELTINHLSFIFGGTTNDAAETTYGDISVLSLPSFNFFRVSDKDSPRSGHSCSATGNSQFISVGGYQGSAVSVDNEYKGWNSSDPSTYGVGIFDMTNLVWSGDYLANASAYDSPEMIKSWYRKGGWTVLNGTTTSSSKYSCVSEASPNSPFPKRLSRRMKITLEQRD